MGVAVPTGSSLPPLLPGSSGRPLSHLCQPLRHTCVVLSWATVSGPPVQPRTWEVAVSPGCDPIPADSRKLNAALTSPIRCDLAQPGGILYTQSLVPGGKDPLGLNHR